MCSLIEIDALFDEAVRVAGPHPNALGFMRRVPGSSHFRKPPIGATASAPTRAEMKRAASECRLAIHVGSWGTATWPIGW